MPVEGSTLEGGREYFPEFFYRRPYEKVSALFESLRSRFTVLFTNGREKSKGVEDVYFRAEAIKGDKRKYQFLMSATEYDPIKYRELMRSSVYEVYSFMELMVEKAKQQNKKPVSSSGKKYGGR